LVSSYKGVRVFIPASHIELFHVADLSQYINKNLEVKIIEFKEEKNHTRIVSSRRDLLKGEKEKLDEETWSKLAKDIVVEGEVRRLSSFGAFVNINGVDGLLHVSEISWGRIEKPGDVLNVGDKVKVYILDVDKDIKKLSLSMKKIVEDPWNNVEIKYPVGNIVLGKMVRFAKFGAFVELEPGVDALVHISQISNKRIDKPSDVLKIGDEVKAKILDVNKEAKKIGLSIKEIDEI
jgi:4-hydroxy-3-methylbut-2-enyl diphosphate reductase